MRPMRATRHVAVLLTTLLAIALLPASASALTFGANLNRVPNNGDTCLDIQLIITQQTCTVQSSNLTTGETPFPPVGVGTVSAVRVRVGPTTGPMQVVVEEALRKDNPIQPGKPTYACCTLRAKSPVFTPAANAVTNIPVNFTVRQDRTPGPSGYYVDQHLALSILSPTVPIPAAVDNNSLVGAWWPAWRNVGEQRVGPSGTFLPAVVLFNAEWTPAGATPPATAPGAVGAPAPVRVPRVAAVRKNLALVRLVCSFRRACIGRLLLQSRAAAAAAGAADSSAAKRTGRRRKRGRRTVTYASVRIRIPARKSKTIRVPLHRAGKRLLRRSGRARAWVNVRVRGTKKVSSRRITLRRAPAGKKRGKRRRR